MFFRNRIYFNKVITRAEELVLSTLGKERGGDAMALLAGAMGALEDRSKHISELLKGYRKSGLSHEVAAIKLIETIVEETEAVIARHPHAEAAERADMCALLESLKEVIDSFTHRVGGITSTKTGDTQYARVVIERAKQLIESTLDADKAYLANTLFATALENDLEAGNIGPEVFEHYKKTGTQEDAAIALIDGTISSIKGVMRVSKRGVALAEQVTDLEEVIDTYMKKSPPRFLPRNGRFAEIAGKVGLERYFRTPR